MQSAVEQPHPEPSGWSSSFMGLFATLGLIWDLANALDDD
jgi:hypothetical protein